ncbi:MAG: hypothetical protein KC503_23925 [Myxococcales bacterium]|nr:hypothetical protein [Myxococcales bacterium]
MLLSRAAFAVSLLALVGCADSGASSADSQHDAARDAAAADGQRDTQPAPDSTRDAAGDARDATADGTRADASPDSNILVTMCASPPPSGATTAPPPPTYGGGTCPALVAGRNTLVSSGAQRELILVLPNNPQPGERFPLIFMWHWLGGSADKMLTRVEVQNAADQQRFIAVIPEAKGDLKLLGLRDLPWPITVDSANQARRDEEHTFFDDMLACVSKQFAINRECVAGFGVSAGALYVAQLASVRSFYLSSFISASGGVAGPGNGVLNNLLLPWTKAQRALPALVLWGGPKDTCVLTDFDGASKNLEKALAADGHFILECVHNCDHSVPPFAAPAPGMTAFAPLWDFVLRHPYWLATGTSPLSSSLPPLYPSWCAPGAGNAQIRSGVCVEQGCAL